LKGIETVAVKEATSRFAARCLHPQVSWKMIREAAKKATTNTEAFKPFKPETPMELRVEFHNSERAAKISERTSITRIDGRTISCTGNNIMDIYRALLA
jgi:D-amino peptidase